MKILLDTHIWVWSVLQPDRLSKRTKKALTDTANEIWISPVSTWEITMLCKKKRLQLNMDADKWVAAVLKEVPFKEAPLTHEIAIASSTIEVPHGDPADRFLAATAKILGLTLSTQDDMLINGYGYKVLPNR